MYIPSSPFLTWLRWSPPESSSVLFGGIVPPDLCQVTCGGGSPTALHSSVTFEPVYNMLFIRGGSPHECLVIVFKTEGVFNTFNAIDGSYSQASALFQHKTQIVTFQYTTVTKIFYYFYQKCHYTVTTFFIDHCISFKESKCVPTVKIHLIELFIFLTKSASAFLYLALLGPQI
jgi:hypothetical protein